MHKVTEEVLFPFKYKDKFLRDSTVSSVTVRNIGIE